MTSWTRYNFSSLCQSPTWACSSWAWCKRDKAGSRWAKPSPRNTSGGHVHQPQSSPATPCPPWEEPQAASFFQMGSEGEEGVNSRPLSAVKHLPPVNQRNLHLHSSQPEKLMHLSGSSSNSRKVEQLVLPHRQARSPLVLAPRFNFDQ